MQTPRRRGRPPGSRSKPLAPTGAADGLTVTRVVGYVRVSTERQVDEGFSLDVQRQKLKSHCAAQDLELVAIEADEGASAKTLDRPGLHRALAMLTEGRADALLVPTLDRLTRRVVDLGHLIETYFAAGRWSLLAVKDHIDTRSAGGRMVLFLIMTVAQWERETIGERTRTAMEFLRTEGVSVGRAPLGCSYALEGVNAQGRRVLQTVDEEAVTVARIRALRAEGLSYARIAAQIAAEGRSTKLGGRWHANTVRLVCLRSSTAPAPTLPESSRPER